MIAWPLKRIISGGQTGADMGGLKAARALGYETGGMAPHGWKTETGPNYELESVYKLKESRAHGYTPRTWWNAIHSDGTVIFTKDGQRIPLLVQESGSKYTAVLCEANHKPFLLNLDCYTYAFQPREELYTALRHWITAHRIEILNVAGNRESVAPGIEARVYAFLTAALTKPPVIA